MIPQIININSTNVYSLFAYNTNISSSYKFCHKYIGVGFLRVNWHRLLFSYLFSFHFLGAFLFHLLQPLFIVVVIILNCFCLSFLLFLVFLFFFAAVFFLLLSVFDKWVLEPFIHSLQFAKSLHSFAFIFNFNISFNLYRFYNTFLLFLTINYFNYLIFTLEIILFSKISIKMQLLKKTFKTSVVNYTKCFEYSMTPYELLNE